MENLRNILIATDLSPASDTVMRGAAALAALTGARLHVLHVYEFHPAPYVQSLPAATFQDRINQIQAALEAQIQRTARAGVDVASREVIIYTAQKAILQRAELVAADLIVIGRHRREGIADAVLGSTADNVVRSAQVPVLIVHQAFSAPLRRVLVPIDLSEPALHALDVALSWLSSLGTADSAPEIIVLHVIPRIYDFEDVPFDSAQVASRLHYEIDASRARAGAPASLRVREEVRWSEDAADEIADFIEKEKVDMAVLGTHGYGAFKRALIGSVSSAVARTAGCPVLLVPPAMSDDAKS